MLSHLFIQQYSYYENFFQKKDNVNSDLKKSNKLINIILKLLGYLEYKAGGSNYFGTSLVGIFKNV